MLPTNSRNAGSSTSPQLLLADDRAQGGAQQLAVGSVRARRALDSTRGSHRRFAQGAVGRSDPLPASPTPFHYVGEEPDKNKTPLRGPLFLWRCGESTNLLALRLTAHRWVRHNPLQEQDPLAGAVVLVEVRGVDQPSCSSPDGSSLGSTQPFTRTRPPCGGRCSCGGAGSRTPVL